MTNHEYTNELIHESSPYLLQHAHNPVNWHAWKPETLAKAVAEDKPILVSIGYSTCHWCHVMERESFEDPSVAALMNELFINIKVDREERPDIDHIYMEAVQFITGAGGWPLNCFLLPDGRPFYGGTYFPPEERYGRASWRQVLVNIAKAYKDQKSAVTEQADRLTGAIAENEKRFISDSRLIKTNDNAAQDLPDFFKKIDEQFDATYGGFGSAPKFPQTQTIDLLLATHYYQKNDEELVQALFTIKKMIRGGIYDQLGGGFARYATDAAWLIPHFEKMLYDNAMLVRTMADVYRITKDTEIEHSIHETLAFICKEMTGTEGGFFSAIDADSEGVEGKFYIWKKEEIENVLGDGTQLFCKIYNVTRSGNWEGHNILNLADSVKDYCVKNKLDYHQTTTDLERQKKILLNKRNERVRPGTDDKILLGWNALMLTAYAEAGMALGNKTYITIAVEQHKYIKDMFRRDDGAFNHTYKDGKAKIDAMFDDYAFYIEALIALFHSTQEVSYLYEARELTEYMFGEFYEEVDGMFYFTGAHADNIVRKKDFFDSATPSGNAVHCRNLMYLGVIFDLKKYSDTAERMLNAMDASVRLYPTSFAYWAKNRMIHHYGLEEVVTSGRYKDQFVEQINMIYSAGRILMKTGIGRGDLILLLNKEETEESLIYLCKDYNCQRPVHSIEAFVEMLNK